MDVKKIVREYENEIISVRRDLHRIPELDTNLRETARYVRSFLEKIGLDVRTFSNTGMTALIRGGDHGPTIAFRADMDALPIHEETALDFAAANGNMHACGHDAHIAMLLVAAKILESIRDSLAGNVLLIFQPAEETTGGAKTMIEEGCMEEPKVDRFVAMHIGSLFPEVQNGQIGIKKGAIMAAVDSFKVSIKGVGGHGARPHECVDPIVISSEIIMSLQKIISREVNPVHGAVLTVGTFHAGSMVNVIPDEAVFQGTVRTLDRKDSDLVERRVGEIIMNMAKANGAEAMLDYKKYYPATVNDNAVTEFAANSAKKIVGSDGIAEISEPSTGTEDVSYYLAEVPGTFLILGSYKANRDGNIYPHHNSKFDIDESVLWIGTGIFVQCAIDYLVNVD